MLPSGTITFLFSDIEGSTRLWEEHPHEMGAAIARHDTIMQQAITGHNGHVVKQRGDGFHAAFASATDAVDAAVAAQQNLQAEDWDEAIGALRVRISLHTSTAEPRQGDYYGPQLNRAARLESIAHGGQVLVSSATRELIRDELPKGVWLIDLDQHRLKDLSRSERVYQLVGLGMQADFPPLRSLEGRQHNLPIMGTSFIGRAEEISEILELFRGRGCRLLTLVGPGGIGKTRLVLMAAAESIDEFPHGVWLVELAAISEPEILPDHISSVFGVTAQEARAGRGVTDVLVEYFKDKTLLLVLDNCEHLVETCAVFAEMLLQRCPQVKLLATSREELGVPGEQTIRVAPLGLPPEETLLPDLELYPAVQLFIERASRARPGFDPTDGNRAVIADICRRLDGIPLAIELAAARVKVLSLKQIAERLQDCFSLLTGGPRTVIPRHQTLQAAMDWSYDLLSDPERALLCRLSVFSGSWTLEAAEEVAAFGEVSKPAVLDLLTHLVDKSLINPVPAGSVMRYGMLVTVRQYSLNRLRERGETGDVHRRHADYFTRLAERADLGLRDANQVESLALLDTEHDNIRLALGWALDAGAMDIALTLVGNMGWFWFMRGHWVESWRWLTWALKLSPDGDPRLRAWAITRAGGLQLIRGNLVDAVALVESALDFYRQQDDLSGIAWCLNLLGQAGTFNQEQYDSAVALLYESVETFRSLGDDWGVAWSSRYIGQIVEFQSGYQESYGLQVGALQTFEAIGDTWNVAHSLYLLGRTALRHMELETARECFERGLEQCKLVEDKVIEAHALRGLAQLALYSGELEVADELYLIALEALGKIGDEGCMAGANMELAEVKRRKGDFAPTGELLSQSLHGYQQLGVEEGMVLVVERYAALVHSMGEEERAARLLGASDACLSAGGHVLTPFFRQDHDQMAATVRGALGDHAYEQLYAEGAAMGLKQAMEYGLRVSGI